MDLVNEREFSQNKVSLIREAETSEVELSGRSRNESFESVEPVRDSGYLDETGVVVGVKVDVVLEDELQSVDVSVLEDEGEQETGEGEGLEAVGGDGDVLDGRDALAEAEVVGEVSQTLDGLLGNGVHEDVLL